MYACNKPFSTNNCHTWHITCIQPAGSDMCWRVKQLSCNRADSGQSHAASTHKSVQKNCTPSICNYSNLFVARLDPHVAALHCRMVASKWQVQLVAAYVPECQARTQRPNTHSPGRQHWAQQLLPSITSIGPNQQPAALTHSSGLPNGMNNLCSAEHVTAVAATAWTRRSTEE